MEESTNIMIIARELLATQNPKGLSILVDHLFMPQETIEYHTAVTLYDFCIANFPNCLTLMLLKFYLSDFDFRFRSIHLLSLALNNFRNRRLDLSIVALDDIKVLLISCLTMKEPEEFDIKLLRRFCSFVAYNVLKLQNQQWEELSDCIFSLAEIQPLKAFQFFIDLPPIYKDFISKFFQKFTEEVDKVLQNPDQDRFDDWSLALQTIVKLGIQGIHTEMSIDKIKNLHQILVNSAKKLIEKEMEQFLLLGLENLEKFISHDKYLYNYNTEQCSFVSSFIDEIQELGTHTKEAATKINLLVKSSHNPGIKLSQGELLDHLNILPYIEVLKAFALTDLEESYGEIAIKRLNTILSDQSSNKVEIDITVIEQLQPLLITCLMKQEISEPVFKLLGKVVYHVAKEVNETWDGLREFIVSHSRTQFKKAVYIFQCLPIPLKVEFWSPVMKAILPEISTRLNPPSKLSVIDTDFVSDFISAFSGGFCAVIHLLGNKDYTESYEEIDLKILGSMVEAVKRDMEVSEAFREVEEIVKRYLDLIGLGEYRFVKELIEGLCKVEEMKEESKIVLERIIVMLKGSKVAEVDKDNELEWI